MKTLKFNLKGKTAFFKKPDVNIRFFTYGHIHKIALIGIFGNIMKLGGYNQQGDQSYPEFYEKLKDIKVAIVPHRPSFSKKFQVFNNTVGYASEEGVLIVEEQWLENVSWDIYLIIRGELEEEIAYRILNSRMKGLPYIGKNDHYADIISPKIIEVHINDQADKIDSLFLEKDFKLIKEDNWLTDNSVGTYLYQETLPIGMEEVANQYIYERFMLTNNKVTPRKAVKIYNYNKKDLYFF